MINKFIILFSACFLFCLSALYSYESTRTRIFIETKDGYKSDKLVFGINEKASNSLDTALGEQEAPPFPPPEGGVTPGFIIFDTTQQAKIWTWLDLRPYPSSDTAWVYHDLKILIGAGDLISLKWSGIGAEIDSVYLIDVLTMGTLVNVNMKQQTSVTMSNEFINQFLLKVKYPSKPISVSESIDNPVEITPNPASEYISLKNIDYNNLKIVNSLGINLEMNIDNRSDRIDISKLCPGLYYLIINKSDKTSIIKSFIKAK